MYEIVRGISAPVLSYLSPWEGGLSALKKNGWKLSCFVFTPHYVKHWCAAGHAGKMCGKMLSPPDLVSGRRMEGATKITG
jgi:hypothetical protein